MKTPLRINSVSLSTVLLCLAACLSSAASAQDNATSASNQKPDQRVRPANRLSRESSPYLLLHAHNPVDWYAWGPEAFEKARSENKPIFLSIGYSSCYWCHVMERLVFSNQEIATFMNEHFVNIKVDREERPDVDDIYMTSLIVYQQAAGQGGGGGWPLSIFLTPDGNPIAGATYLPPADTDGRPGFLNVANQVSKLWNSNPERLKGSASIIAAEVRRLSGPRFSVEEVDLSHSLLDAAADDISSRYDPVNGGVDWNPARPDGPRFPNVPRLQLLLTLSQTADEDAADSKTRTDLRNIVIHSLRSMAMGGLRDHLAGGFHRYSTDRSWHVPHFEKMLYDQAQLLQVYTRAAGITNDPLFFEVAGEIADFVKRELTLPGGGFCSALDAETNAIEGEYYVWQPQQIEGSLAEDAELFMTVYGMKEENPFEHGYVLRLPRPTQESLSLLNIEQLSGLRRIEAAKSKLLEVRNKRQRPMLDDKVLTEWNAMMIQALAQSSQLPGRQDDLEAAKNAAQFLLDHLRKDDGTFYRSWRNDTAVYDAYLDDYAYLAAAMGELHQATNDAQWLQHASDITRKQIELFYDQKLKAFFYTSANHEQLIARTCTVYDSVYPSGFSVTVRNLLELSKHNDEFKQIASDTMGRFAPTMSESPAACAGMGLALHDLLSMNESADVSAANSRESGTILCGLKISDESITNKASTHSDEKDESTATIVFKPVSPEPNPSSGQAEEKRDRPLSVGVYPFFDKLERGGKCPVAIEITIDKEWHINANPSNPDFLIPTELKITSKQKIKLTRVKYPAHQLMTMEGETEPYHVYGGKVIIYALLETEASETAEFGELEVQLRYQACNEMTCSQPDKIVQRGKLPLANPGDPIRKINEDKFPKPKEPAAGSQ